MLSKLPPARTENIVVQNTDKEVLIYDLVTNKAYCLNETSSKVYEACDGKTSFEDLKNKYDFTDDLIFFALDELRTQNLIEDSYTSPFKGIKRREVIKKIGLASMIALPVIISLMAPTSAMAAASCGGIRAPGFIFGCTPLQAQCFAAGSPNCQSCSASSVFNVGPGTCDTPAPFLCTCE